MAGARRLLRGVGRAVSLIQEFLALPFLVLGLGAALPIGPVVQRHIGKALRAAALAAGLVVAVGRTLDAAGRYFRARRGQQQNGRQHSA